MNKIIINMDKNTIVDKVKNILDNQNIPERIIKVEKKEKGLYERTQDSVILLTEDNKMMLTD
jgi:hypothetical protein